MLKNFLHVHVHGKSTSPLNYSHFLHMCTCVTCTCNMYNPGVMRSNIYCTQNSYYYCRVICDDITGVLSSFRAMSNWSSCQNVCIRCYNTQFDRIMTSYVLMSDIFPCQSWLERLIPMCNSLIPIEVWLNLVAYVL